jgi:hypothetical protein
LIIQTPAGTFSSKKLVHSNGKVAASRLIRKDIPLDLPSEVKISENLSAARCRVYVRKDLKVFLYFFLEYVYFHKELTFKMKVENTTLE